MSIKKSFEVMNLKEMESTSGGKLSANSTKHPLEVKHKLQNNENTSNTYKTSKLLEADKTHSSDKSTKNNNIKNLKVHNFSTGKSSIHTSLPISAFRRFGITGGLIVISGALLGQALDSISSHNDN